MKTYTEAVAFLVQHFSVLGYVHQLEKYSIDFIDTSTEIHFLYFISKYNEIRVRFYVTEYEDNKVDTSDIEIIETK